MNPQIDFSGFHYRTDRVYEDMTDLMEVMRKLHPEIDEMEIRIRRSFFGTYSARLSGHVYDQTIEISEQSMDPLDCFEQCLGKFQLHVSEAKSRAAFAGLLA